MFTKKLRVYLVLGLLYFFSPLASNAQPNFQSFGNSLERGFSIGTGIQINDDRTLLNGSIGFVTRSQFEIGAMVTRLKVDGADESRTGIGLYFTSSPVQQTEELPISITISSSYLFHLFSGDGFDALEDLGIDTSGGETFIAAGVGHAFSPSPVITIIPELEVGYVNTRTTVSARGESESTNEEDFFMGLCARVIVSNEGRPISVMPRLRFADGNTIGGIALNIGIPSPSK